MASIAEIATKYHEIRQEKLKLDSDLREVKQRLQQAESELLEEFNHAGLSRVDLPEKGSFFIANRKFYKIADKDSFMEFIRQNGDTDLLTVQHQTLNAYAKEQYESATQSGNEEFDIPGLSFITKTNIRVRS